MSGIRKLKRDKSLHKEQKTSTKLSLGGIVLVVGIATLLFGSFYAIYNHIVYTSGTSEHTLETKGGPLLLPEEGPGNPGRRESAAMGWKIAGIDILLILLSMFTSIIVELLQDAIGKLHRRTGERQRL
jgi:hypothetical protein